MFNTVKMTPKLCAGHTCLDVINFVKECVNVWRECTFPYTKTIVENHVRSHREHV
jgi:hypothetical protein